MAKQTKYNSYFVIPMPAVMDNMSYDEANKEAERLTCATGESHCIVEFSGAVVLKPARIYRYEVEHSPDPRMNMKRALIEEIPEEVEEPQLK